ncbi:MAG: hypothetical protein KDA47_20445, partial [Planctomycetales bacterium]|nr:hypothetical protein [Planctomycetales bacterium]
SLDEWGQNVRKAFPLSDIFVDVDSHQSFPNSLQRAMEIVFSHPFHTPTRDEFGMNQAEAAALRSSALGRQVGAVITTLGGDIISVGTNEVPRANGGLYWEGDSPDNRDFTLGRDSNDRFKEKLLGEILQKLQTATWLRDDLNRAELATLIDKLIYDNDSVLTGAHVENIIEFGRCVHAEMAAIVDAARRGVSVDGSVLYTTTFPCHECARHIVAAGIRRVVYRVPYPKSLVRELYPDSIDVDGDLDENTHVTFQPFVGIAPRRFRQFFEMRQRKDRRGFVVQWKRDKARPNLGDYVPNYGLIEKDEAEFILEFSGDARE